MNKKYQIDGAENTTPAGSPVPIHGPTNTMEKGNAHPVFVGRDIGVASAMYHQTLSAEDMAMLFEARYLEYAANWRRICQALDKHHPQWIDGNGSAIDKVIKFIEEVKS